MQCSGPLNLQHLWAKEQLGAAHMPASRHVVALFVAHMSNSLSWKTIRVYLSPSPTSTILTILASYLDHCRASGSKPLFQLKSKGPLTAKFFRCTLHRTLRRSGFSATHFNTHSFCIGAAPAASKVGLSATEIMQLGRWRSSAFQGYIHHTPAHTAAAAWMAAAP